MSANNLQTENVNVVGNLDAKIVVVCDAPSSGVFTSGGVLSGKAMALFAEVAKEHGFVGKDFAFVSPCPPIPEREQSSEGRINKYVGQFREEVLGILQQFQNAKTVVYLGKTAGRQVVGRPVQITKARGKFETHPDFGVPIFPCLSPTNVLARPEVRDTFVSDFAMLAQFRDAGWRVDGMARADETADFSWCLDLSFLLENPPKVIAVDTETDGLRWMENDTPLLASLCWNERSAIAVPLDCDYYPELSPEHRDRLIGQLKELLENPQVAVVGHNLKFDIHMLRRLGIEIANWYADSLQLAFAADENMDNKNLADCVKRWVPSLASYSDAFEEAVDYRKMREVPHEMMLPYACGDALATFLLSRHLVREVRSDDRQWKAFAKVQMPALRTFSMMEHYGLRVDVEQLANLEKTLAEMETETYDKLIRKVPAEVKRKHVDKGLSFSRDEFVRDILFSDDGFGLTPRVFTSTTAKLAPHERVPSVSAKDHLPYFASKPLVADLIAYKKLQKMRSTYVGKASRFEYSEIKRLKSGGIPKRIVSAMESKGLLLMDDGRVLNDNGEVVRSRPREVDVNGQVEQVTNQVSLNDSETLLITADKRLIMARRSDATGMWKYLRNEEYLHPSFLLHSTVTGRTSSRDPNAQNFPKRGAMAKEFRKIFVPRDGFRFIQADLSQAELRVAAWMAREPTMLKIYREGGDIHTFTAAATLGLEVNKFSAMKGSDKDVDPKLKRGGFDGSTYGEYFDFKRFQAKAINFGFLYGMGWRKFKEYCKTDYGLDLSEDDAQSFRATFFNLYPKLEVWHRTMREFVKEHGFVRSLHGALRRLPNITSDDEIIRGECERQAINSPVQRMASDLGLIAMSEFGKLCDWETVRPLAFIHDAVVIEARADKVMDVAKCIKWCMQNQPIADWFGIESPIPIVADIEVGDSLAKLEAIKVDAELAL